MNILLIHQHFFPEPSGTAKSAYEIARYFATKGHDVKVITEFPNRNFQSFSNNNERPPKYQIIDGIQVFRIKNKFKYSHNVIQRLLAYLWFTLASCMYGVRLAHKQKTQIVLTIQAIPSALPGSLLSILFKQKHIFYCTDMMPDLGIVSGMLKNNLFINILHLFEKFTYKHCTAIFAVTQMMVDEIRKRTINPNVYVLSDWLDEGHYNLKKDFYVSMLEEKYKLRGKKVLLYIGNIGFLQNIGVFVELAIRMQEDKKFSDYVLIIGGNGVQAGMLNERIKKNNLKNIKFIGIVDRDKVPSFLNLSKCLLMNFLDHPHLRLYRSSKIFDYIIAEKPVLVGAAGELEKIVSVNNLGRVANPSNVDDLFDNLVDICNCNYIIDNKSLIDEYNIKNILDKFENKLKMIGIS